MERLPLDLGLLAEGRPTKFLCKGYLVCNFPTSHNDKDNQLACVAIYVVQDCGLS